MFQTETVARSEPHMPASIPTNLLVLLVVKEEKAPPFLVGAPGNSSEPQGRSLENRTELAPVCAPEGPLCPQANVCLPLDTPCHPGACANGSMPGPGLPGVSYVLQKEFLFSVPAGPPAQYSVRISGPCFLPPSTPEAPASRHTDQMQSLRPSHPVPCGLLLPQ